ncbi:MAG: DUF2807 domain-containing protein [Pseudomonadota bacterium]
MKTLTTTAIAAALLFAGTACVQTASAKDKSDSNRDVVQTYDLDGFDEIKVMGVYELEIEVGKSFSVRTEASQKEAEDLDVRVSGDRLILDNRQDNGKRWNNNNNRKSVLAVITMPSLSDLQITGVATGEVTGVDGGSLDVSLEGVGDLQLEGRCDSLDVELAGVGDIDARDLVCTSVDAEMGGVGELTVHATKSVDASSGGVGQVVVYGDPEERDVDDGFMAKVRFK